MESGDMLETARTHLGAAQTVAFVGSVLSSGAKIFDAGCGDGVVARQLMDAGFEVQAIDVKEDAVSKAKSIGVAAEVADILTYACDTKFDAVLMSRSFHHMNQLELALQRAKALLKEDGKLILEEFAAELMDVPTVLWYFGLRAFCEAGGEKSETHCSHGSGPGRLQGPKLEDGKIPSDPLRAWRKHYFEEHDVATSQQMLDALKRQFGSVEASPAANLYRYFVDAVSPAEAKRLLEWEESLCSVGAIMRTGVRVVAKIR